MRCIFLILAIFAAIARSEPPSFLDPAAPPRQELFLSQFIVPTEHNQRDSIPLVKNAPAGAYVSVGLERSFVGAAITSAATHLVILDRNPDLIWLARYNAGLLALARDRADYLQLRFRTDLEEISRRAESSAIASDYRQALSSPEVQDLFYRQIRTPGRRYSRWGGRQETFSVFNAPPPPPENGGEYGYRDVNYLYDDRLFGRLQAMAREGRISAEGVDLANQQAVGAVVKKLADRKVGLAVLDVSDTWFFTKRYPNSFLPPSDSLALWRSFGAVAKPESVLLLTAWDSREGRKPDVRPEVEQFWPWIYFGMTYQNIDKPAAERTLKRIVKYYDIYGEGNPAWAGRLDQSLSLWPPLHRPGCLLALAGLPFSREE